MVSSLAFLLIVFLSSAGYGTPLDTANGTSVALTPAASESPSLAANISASDIAIGCDDQYGENLDVRDCESAIGHINPNDAEINYMERTDPERPKTVIPLPYRLMGGMSFNNLSHLLKTFVLKNSPTSH